MSTYFWFLFVFAVFYAHCWSFVLGGGGGGGGGGGASTGSGENPLWCVDRFARFAWCSVSTRSCFASPLVAWHGSPRAAPSGGVFFRRTPELNWWKTQQRCSRGGDVPEAHFSFQFVFVFKDSEVLSLQSLFSCLPSQVQSRDNLNANSESWFVLLVFVCLRMPFQTFQLWFAGYYWIKLK